MIESLADMTKVLVKSGDEPISLIKSLDRLLNSNVLSIETIQLESQDEDLQEISFPQKPEIFPLTIFPNSIREYIEKTCQAIKCPIDFMALSVLVAVSALIGNQAKIRITYEWLEVCIVFAAFVGTPGVRKTPALMKALFAIIEIQKELTRQYEQELMAYEFNVKQFEADFDVWKATSPKSRKIEDRPEMPTPPKHRQIRVIDITIETVMELMQESSLLMVRDEFAGWITSMNQYKGGSGSERQAYLEFWNGTPIDVNRKGGKRSHVENPFISIIGGIQPDRLSHLLGDTVNDGFLERILFVYPDTFPEIMLEDIEVEVFLKDAYLNASQKLYYHTKENGQENVIIDLTPEAKEWFKQYYDSLYEEIRQPGFNKQIEGAWVKLSSYFARFTLILHLLHWACDSDCVDEKLLANEKIVYFSSKLIDYFKTHLKRVYGFIHSDADEKKSLEAVEWIQSKTKGVVRTRTVQQAKLCGVKNKTEAEELFTLLCNRGYGTAQYVKSANGQKTMEFTLSKTNE